MLGLVSLPMSQLTVYPYFTVRDEGKKRKKGREETWDKVEGKKMKAET